MVNKTISIICGTNDERAEVLKRLILKNKNYSLVDTTNSNSDYQIFTANYVKQLEISLSAAYFDYLQASDKLTIVDIDDNYFLDGALAAVFTVAIVSAKFVTCASAALQEIVYENTGRLAAIVENPVDTELFLYPDAKTIVTTTKELDILWVGFARELFSIKPYLNKKDYNIKTVLVTDYVKKVNSLFNNADIVFLPKTFTQADEINRAVKVRECIISGKFVVAPDLEFDYNSLAFNGSLEGGVVFYMEGDVTRWIERKQKALKEASGFDNSYNQLNAALENAPKDTFNTTLDLYLSE